jgi:hypothetical protein
MEKLFNINSLLCLLVFFTIKTLSAQSETEVSSQSCKIEIYTEKNNYQTKFGFIDRSNNNIIIYPIYDSVRNFNFGLAAVKFQGYWGFINIQGNTLGEIVFERVTDFHDSIAGVKKNGLWQLINSNGIAITNQKFQDIGTFNLGLINVKSLTGGWGYMDKSGQMIKSFSYRNATPFIDEYSFVSIKDEMRLINRNFETLTIDSLNGEFFARLDNYCTNIAEGSQSFKWCEPYVSWTPKKLIRYGDGVLINDIFLYDLKLKKLELVQAYVLNPNFLALNLADNNYLLRIYLKDGKTAHKNYPTTSNYWDISLGISGDYVTIEIDDKFIILNPLNEAKNIVNNAHNRVDVTNLHIWRMYTYDSYNEESEFQNCLLYNPKLKSFIDSTNYRLCKPFSENFSVIKTDNPETERYGDFNYGFINTSGEVLGNQISYDDVSDFYIGRAIVKIANNYLIIDTNSNQIGEVYSDLDRVNANLFKARLDGKYFLIDRNGNQISKKAYDFVDTKIYDGLIRVETNGLWGYIDLNGNEIIPPKYKLTRGFSKGEASVCYEDKTSNCDGRYCTYFFKINKKGVKISENMNVWYEYSPN